MYKVNINRVSIKTVLDTRFKKKSGLYPIKIQVFYQKVQKYYITGKELSEDDWKKLPDTRIAGLVKIRNSIKASFDLISRLVEQIWSEGNFSINLLNIRLGKTAGETLNQTLKIKIEQLEKEGRIGSMYYYDCALRSIVKFAGGSISFNDITEDWLKKFENFLLKGGMSHSTIGMRMRAIRTAVNMAIKDNIMSKNSYPFGRDKYEIKTAESIKKALTLVEKTIKMTP